MTVLLYVRRKGWPLKSVVVECERGRVHCRDSGDCEEGEDTYIDVIWCQIRLEGDLTEEQRERIERIARRCPVHRTLTTGLRIEDRMTLVT